MPEIKHNFSQGKMNKDLDERLVPNGQYIEANNIQVSTPEGSDVGTARSLLGNSAIPTASPTTMSTSGVCIGAVADEKNDCAYWLIASSNVWDNSAPASITTYKDVIYKTEYNFSDNTHTTTPVFIDFYSEKHPASALSNWVGSASAYTSFDTTTTNLSTGMYAIFVTSVAGRDNEVRQITKSSNTISFDAVEYNSWDYIDFSWIQPDINKPYDFNSNQKKSRVLRFDKNKLVTGINIVDDLLFWTDNNSEPKRINTARSIEGTEASELNKNTRIVLNERDIEVGDDVFVKEEDITVIKKSPKRAPVLDIKSGIRSGNTIVNSSFNLSTKEVGGIFTFTADLEPNYKPNDILVIASGFTPTISTNHARLRVISVNSFNVKVVVLTLNPNAPTSIDTYKICLEEDAKIIFKEKFARFATRWKYADGEYSNISPFSEPAFSTGDFNYNQIKGFNSGMVNTLKELIIEKFIPKEIPKEVTQIDILYKESDSPVIYTVDNIFYDSPSWNTVDVDLDYQGTYTISSENIYSAISSNQILRPFDSVPKKALAQSIVGNRVVYGNYVENYDINDGEGSFIKPKINAFINFRTQGSSEILQNPSLDSSDGNRNVVPNWSYNAGPGGTGWKTFYGYMSNLTGFENKDTAGVADFRKVWQTVDLEDDETYIASIRLGNYLQGNIRLHLVGPTKSDKVDINPETVTGDINGVHEFELTLSRLNATEGTENFYTTGKNFMIQAVGVNTTANTLLPFIGQIINFSLKKPTSARNKSIKSQRTYQLGVVYADEFGRQTPVLTSENSSIEVPKIDSSNTNAINIEIDSAPPEFASSFKFFVKETSSEYYNLAVDRIYETIDGMAWLSFPSNERNKIDEETYLVLKKQLNGQAVTSESSTYKVISIENDTPGFLKQSRKELGTASGNWSSSNSLNAIFTDINYRPSEDQQVLKIEKDLWINEENGAELEGYGSLILQFESGSIKSGWIKADAVNLSADNVDYVLHLHTPISDTDSDWIMNGNNFNTGVSVTIAHYEDTVKPEFDGKFFVKVQLDGDLKQFVQQQAVLTQDSFGIVAKSETWYASDDNAPGVSPNTGTSSRYQKDSSSSGNYVQDTSVKAFTYDSRGFDRHPFKEEVTFTDATCKPNNGSDVIVHTANANIQPFWNVTGDGIPVDSNGFSNVYVEEVISDTSFKISSNANAGDGVATKTLTFTRWFDNKGDSGYNAGRGALVEGFGSGKTFYMSQSAVRNWGRILKFLKYSGWTYEKSPDNSQARKNFFIDKVRYVGIQPLNNNKPQEGLYTDPGHYDHNARFQRNSDPNSTTNGHGLAGVSLFPKYGRGIFEANGNEVDIKDNPDPFFRQGHKYMELSYAKIWAESSLMNIDEDKVGNESSYATAWNVGSPTNTNHIDELKFVSKIKVGSRFRFSGDPNEKVYQITNVKQERRYNHTVYPGGNGDYQIVKTWDGEEYKPSNLPNSINNKIYSLLASGTGNSTATRDYYLRFKHAGAFLSESNPYTSNISLSNAQTCLEDERTAFGLATNRRLTWIIEFEDVTVTQDGSVSPDYNPVNEETSKNQTGTGTDNLMDEVNRQFIEFVEPSFDSENQLISDSPAVFETQPKTNEGLDIYYEASDFIDINTHDGIHELPWFNCYSFGNGVESNRIKDDFNQVFIDKNAIVSTTAQGEYEENRRKYGLIYSGIYNSKNGVNNTNQFIAAEKITKDVNPEYGSIQKIHARNSDLLTLCEDKILRIQANKDALFNADGNVNVTATSNVLGQTIPFVGDYGISQNPESFATEAYRAYFTDKQRGVVLRLSMDGLTVISDYGMKDWFKDNLKPASEIMGTYDVYKKEYNVTLKPGEESTNYTVSYNENVKGWSSFKSFIPEQGVSFSGNYYTFASDSSSNAKVWWHHQGLPLTTENGVSAKTANNFYGTQYYSDITTVFNEEPGIVKTFKTLSYEGTQSKIHQNTGDTENYYNLAEDEGWHAETITTDKQTGSVNEFIEKEGKWFNFIKGDTTTLANLDASEFTVQGLGKITAEDI